MGPKRMVRFQISAFSAFIGSVGWKAAGPLSSAENG